MGVLAHIRRCTCAKNKCEASVVDYMLVDMRIFPAVQDAWVFEQFVLPHERHGHDSSIPRAVDTEGSDTWIEIGSHIPMALSFSVTAKAALPCILDRWGAALVDCAGLIDIRSTNCDQSINLLSIIVLITTDNDVSRPSIPNAAACHSQSLCSSE